MSKCNQGFVFPIKVEIHESDFPPFDARRIFSMDEQNGEVIAELVGTNVRFAPGDIRKGNTLPNKVVFVCDIDGEPHHLVVIRMDCEGGQRICGTIVKIGQDRGVGTWITEEEGDDRPGKW